MRISDWSSDVCSSDLGADVGSLGEDAAAEAREDRDQRSAEGERDERVDDGAVVTADGETTRTGQIPEEDRDREQSEARHQHTGDRKSVVSGKSVSVRVDTVGGRINKKKNKRTPTY